MLGEYKACTSEGIPKKEGKKLECSGLPQGAVHSGFLSNVYLEAFDKWVVSSLSTAVDAKLRNFQLTYYARYVDDMRIVGHFDRQPGAPFRRAYQHPLHQAIGDELSRYGLTLSKDKSIVIEQNSQGTLLTTGQVAERMQTIKTRLYLPLPPEDLEEAAKDIRLLFNTEVIIPNHTPLKGQPHLDNPGVRADSRRRFAAGKFVRVANELNLLSPGWLDDNRNFASELVQVWLSQPEQVQLLQYALRIGISGTDATAVRKRIERLENTDDGYGYFAYLAAFFLDRASTRWAALPNLEKLPLGKWARKALESEVNHPVLTNKARQYLLTRVASYSLSIREKVTRHAPDSFTRLVDAERKGLNFPCVMHPAELAALVPAIAFIEKRKEALIDRILRHSSIENSKRFLRCLLASISSLDEQKKIVAAAEKKGINLQEFALFHKISNSEDGEPLYKPILRGEFQNPQAWCLLALKLADLLNATDATRPDAITLSSRGLFNAFTIVRSGDGDITFAKKLTPNLSFAGYSGKFGSLVGSESSRSWSLPVGVLLHAAATGNPSALLGISGSQRFRTLHSLRSILRQNGALPETAGDEILMRLFSWPGSRVEPFSRIADFKREISHLSNTLKDLSSNGVSICDVRGPTPSLPNQPFVVVLCQVRSSYPSPASDTTVRRALAAARIIGREQFAQNRSPSLVIFPEASVSVDSLTTLRRFVQATGSMVLAGLEFRDTPCGTRKLNELVWIIPARNNDSRPLELRQAKIHPTKKELRLTPPVCPANPPVIWRIGASGTLNSQQRLAAINCYEFTDLRLRELLRGRVEALVIAANNKDVPTFDNLLESTHYDLFCHVVLVNASLYGGSAVRAPYSEPYQRRIFDIHGGNLFAVNICELDLSAVRNTAANNTMFKTQPAGFSVRI